ncbi:hypothetical protein D3C86_1471760 [compost metagenome]
MMRVTSKIVAVGLVVLSLMLGCADEENGFGVGGRKVTSHTPPAESPGDESDPVPSPTPTSSAIATPTPKPSPSPTPTPTLAPLPSPVIIASPGEDPTPPSDASESFEIGN